MVGVLGAGARAYKRMQSRLDTTLVPEGISIVPKFAGGRDGPRDRHSFSFCIDTTNDAEVTSVAVSCLCHFSMMMEKVFFIGTRFNICQQRSRPVGLLGGSHGL